jgi:hypothetical protein
MEKDTLLSEIVQRREPQHCFICWEDSSGARECELLDYFIRARAAGEDIVNFELLDIEQMWEELLGLGVEGFSRTVRKGVEVLDWTQSTPDGEERVRSCCFRPEGLSAIYDEVKAQLR